MQDGSVTPLLKLGPQGLPVHCDCDDTKENTMPAVQQAAARTPTPGVTAESLPRTRCTASVLGSESHPQCDTEKPQAESSNLKCSQADSAPR